MTAVAAGRGSNDFGPSRMSSLSVQAFGARSPAAAALRFGSPGGAGDESVQWLLRRNCSMTPVQLIAFYLSLCAWSLAIAVAFWWYGATLVMPFASLELLAIGAALFVYARHAGDRERVILKPGRLTVECTLGNHTDRGVLPPERHADRLQHRSFDGRGDDREERAKTQMRSGVR